MKFSSKPVAEHGEVPVADDGRFEEIVAEWASRDRSAVAPTHDGRNSCYVVCVASDGVRDERRLAARLDEMVGLVRAQGDPTVGREIHRLSRPDPRMLVRPGVATEIAARAADTGADLLVLDAELSPSQMRNLEAATGMAVCDREAVILNVFHRHAKTRRARVQVEIAHLEYLRPRIRGLGLEMDQQAGGVVGSRGPGETASELLARKLDSRLAMLRKTMAKITQAGHQQRRRRERCKRIALVGYTNAGKTSLMNALTGAGLSAADRPFETLDATSRSLTRHGGDVVVSDTVGFIRDLPERLFASFETSLAELADASLIALVIDGSDPEHELHIRTTEAVLARLGAGSNPRFYVFNKSDRIEGPAQRERLAHLASEHPRALVSSRDPGDVAALKDALLARIRPPEAVELFVPYRATAAIAMAYARSRVLDALPTENGLVFQLEAEPQTIERIRQARSEQNAGSD